MAAVTFAWGEIQGRITFSQSTLDAAAKMAGVHFAEAEAIEFAGNAVEDYAVPDWFKDRSALFPDEALRALGFQRNDAVADRVLATASVGPHIDDADGPAFILVMFNDGLKFKQGKINHVAQAGEWFIFNDRIKHEVREGKNTTTYLIWSVPLKPWMETRPS